MTHVRVSGDKPPPFLNLGTVLRFADRFPKIQPLSWPGNTEIKKEGVKKRKNFTSKEDVPT